MLGHFVRLEGIFSTSVQRLHCLLFLTHWCLVMVHPCELLIQGVCHRKLVLSKHSKSVKAYWIRKRRNREGACCRMREKGWNVHCLRLPYLSFPWLFHIHSKALGGPVLQIGLGSDPRDFCSSRNWCDQMAPFLDLENAWCWFCDLMCAVGNRANRLKS